MAKSDNGDVNNRLSPSTSNDPNNVSIILSTVRFARKRPEIELQEKRGYVGG